MSDTTKVAKSSRSLFSLMNNIAVSCQRMTAWEQRRQDTRYFSIRKKVGSKRCGLEEDPGVVWKTR